MATGGVTVGEVDRKLDLFRDDVKDRFDGLERKIDGLSFVPAGVYASDQAALRDRVGSLEDRNRRIFQALVGLAGTLAAALLAGVVDLIGHLH